MQLLARHTPKGPTGRGAALIDIAQDPDAVCPTERHCLTTLYAAPAAATRSETLPGTALRTVGSEIWIVMPVRLLHQAEISDNLMLCVP